MRMPKRPTRSTADSPIPIGPWICCCAGCGRSSDSGADSGGELGACLVIEPADRPADSQALAAVRFRNDMEMHVRDRLVRSGAVVLEDVVFLHARGGDH